MKALSVRQPWAWLLFHGKLVENRDWATDYKGPLAFVRRFDPALAEAIPPARELVRGCVIGIVEQTGCVQNHPSPWFQGRWGHVYREAREFTRPAPARGSPVGGIEQYEAGRLRL